jgi:ABC-type transporter Mla subunit MlaD
MAMEMGIKTKTFMSLQDLTPQLRTRLNRMEKAVGWFVFVAAALLVFGFGYYIFHTAERKGWFLTKARFMTYVQSSAGLKVGDPVYMMGFPVGEITLIHAMPPGDRHNVRVEFQVRDNYFRYIWSRGSLVKINGGLLGQSQLEVTRATNGFALAVTQPVFFKTLPELEQLAVTQPGEWQLSQFVFDSGSNIVLRPYAELTSSNLQLLAVLNLESNAVFAYNNQLNRDRVVATWKEDFQRYDFYDHQKDGPLELPALESVPVAERLDRMISQVENALPGILSLTNQVVAVLDHAVQATSNLNTTLIAAQPMVTNFALISAQLREPGGPLVWALGTNGSDHLQGTLTNLDLLLGHTDTNLNRLTAEVSLTLENLAGITSNLNVQVQANSNLLGGISKAVVSADDLMQGLKRHWLLRSAFKAKATSAPAKK